MYDKVPTDLKFVEREKEVEMFWEANHIFEKSIKMREGCKPYVFYDGPPTANGKPHIGHVETRVIKDMIPRYRAMKGYMVPRKAGWDTHGLPVELVDALNVSSPEALEKALSIVKTVMDKHKSEARPMKFSGAKPAESLSGVKNTGDSSLRKAMGLPE